jgi:hypothetical protein
MKSKALVSVLLASILLAACTGGPPNKKAEEIIHGVYLQEATIVEKSQCELTSWMEADGQTNAWLVRYRFKKSGSEGGMLMAETDGEWQSYMPMVDSCPE